MTNAITGDSLADKPSKHYICDALDSLSSFSKLQRKKLNAEKKRRVGNQKLTEAQPDIGSSSSRTGSAGFSFSFTADSPARMASPPTDFPFGTGGIEDVD